MGTFSFYINPFECVQELHLTVSLMFLSLNNNRQLFNL